MTKLLQKAPDDSEFKISGSKDNEHMRVLLEVIIEWYAINMKVEAPNAGLVLPK